MMLGQFPAAALIYRKGYLDEGKPVVIEHRPVEQLWERTLPLIAEDPTYDPNRDLGDPARRSNLTGGVDPLAFLVGPVKVVYDTDPSKTGSPTSPARSTTSTRRPHRNRPDRVDYGKGSCTVDAPRAQGAAGFLGKSPGEALRRDDHLDQRLRLGRRRLPRRPATEGEQPRAGPGRDPGAAHGWVEHAATFAGDNGKETYKGKQVDSTGKLPWAVENTDVTLSIANPAHLRDRPRCHRQTAEP